MNKKEKRDYYKRLRLSMDKREVMEKSRVICERFISSELYKSADVIMLYSPIQNEVDLSLILERIRADKKRAALPVMDGDDIRAVYIDESREMKEGRFGVLEPQNAERAAEEDIDLIIAPGLAFDKNGARLGFGKGFYDRFLPKTRAVRVALCYDFQLDDGVEMDSRDEFMDYIFTEKGAAQC